MPPITRVAEVRMLLKVSVSCSEDKTRYGFRQGGFAGAVEVEQPDHFTAAHSRSESLEHGGLAEAFGQMMEFKYACNHVPSPLLAAVA
jgi:hypothetical protein